MPTSLATPGVYINEVNAFPNSVVPVATAIPAFIGYTARASYNGKSYTNIPVQIESFQEFITFFGVLDPTGKPAAENLQYVPVYYTIPSTAKAPATPDLVIGKNGYDVMPDASTVYYLYNSIKLFYQNGGGTCYVVSVGQYGAASGKPIARGTPLVNPNIDPALLMGALTVLELESDPTMIVVPDAALLKTPDNTTVTVAILMHCDKLKSRVAVLDVQAGFSPDPNLWMNDITAFRTSVGLTGLNYAAAYYPFLRTGVLFDSDINFVNLGGVKTLSTVLPDAATPAVKALLASAGQPPGPTVPTALQIENALRQASPTYSQIHDVVLAKMNILPPSGAMAGAYTLVDDEKGVWHAPANISLASVLDTTLKITDLTQGPMNVDAATGKSVNAIRLFPGKGVIVWGARTLDGNSDDWRYINVRRTLIMLEQSMKFAAYDYVFEPNDANTWSLVKSMLNNFLTSQWTQGALVGPSPETAFSVSVGLGSTMTAEDILQGIMNISIKVAVSHPAEFIVINIQQQMQSAA